jgi:predicted Rossmann-fold nucleotide-binding protein
MKYRLPTLAYDTILFTGLHYVGRDTLLITSSDAVVSIGGRLGTLHEFTIAMETDTPIGFLQGAGGISEQIQVLMSLAHPLRHGAMVTFNDNAEQLIKELTDFLDVAHEKYRELYK